MPAWTHPGCDTVTIRVGVDGSGPSRAALTWAARRAASEGSPLELVHVIDGDRPTVDPGSSEDESRSGVVLLEEATALARRSAPSVELNTVILQGSVAWELAATSRPGDLLVVGTHKTGYLTGRALGTRGIVIASVSPGSVAVIPDASVAARRGVVVGVVEGSAWVAAVSWGAREAPHLGNELTLVHASADADNGQALLAEAAALAAQVHPSLVIRRRMSRRRPAEALLDSSRSAGLLVLGTSRRSTERGGYLGSTTHEVLLNINAPVVVARA